MKCAVYIRVSTEEQAKEGYSLAAQTDKIVEYIKSKGWTYSQIYNDDGYSAASRPDCVIIVNRATVKLKTIAGAMASCSFFMSLPLLVVEGLALSLFEL